MMTGALMKRIFFDRWKTMMPLLALIVTMALAPGAANAQTPGNCTYETGTATCTNNACFDFDNNFLGKLGNATDRAKGIMEDAINQVALAISFASKNLYTGIISASPFSFDFTFLDALGAMLTLYIIFYGVGLLFGFVQATLLDAFIRLFKIGILLTLIQPEGILSFIGGFFDFNPLADGGWGFFSNYVVRFFNQGTTEIIMLMVHIAQGDPLAFYLDGCNAYTLLDLPYNVGCPFQILDQSVKVVFSPRMFVTMIGAFSTPPFGIIMVVALLVSIFSFFMVLIRAMQVYALSLVAKAILFGIAPIFISFLLFEKTRPLFTSWLGQVISYSLQPIMLFTFLAFFGLILKSAAYDLLPPNSVHLCYIKSAQQASTPIDIHAWKFGCVRTAGGPIEPYYGRWTWDGAEDQTACPPDLNGKFPMDPVKILIFLLLCYLMYKISDVAISVAQDLAGGAGAALNSGGGALQNMIGGGGKGLLGGKKK